MSSLTFKPKPYSIDRKTVVLLPDEVSAKLPSRGMAMAEATIGSKSFQVPLEPDGNKGHWFEVTAAMSKAGLKEGSMTSISLDPLKEWPNPSIPKDLKDALKKHAPANKVWNSITPIARWDWIRWIRSTNSAETRKKRIGVAMSQMKSGKSRPCCFNRNMCTVMAVSKSGVLRGDQEIR